LMLKTISSLDWIHMGTMNGDVGMMVMATCCMRKVTLGSFIK
jgi:hypothetical protein